MDKRGSRFSKAGQSAVALLSFVVATSSGGVAHAQVAGETGSGLQATRTNGTADGAWQLNPVDRISGTFSAAGEQAWFKFDVALRSSFRLALLGTPRGSDYAVQVFDSSLDKPLTQSDVPKNLPESITGFTLNPGSYYIKVFSKAASAPGNFNLDVSTRTIPVILVPGIGGSKLNANGSLAWVSARGLGSDALGLSWLTSRLALKPVQQGSQDVTQEDPQYSVTVQEDDFGLGGISVLSETVALDWAARYYEALIQDLKKEGYEPGKTLFGLPYDWRLDVRTAQRALTNRINQALASSGADRVQLVAHSMGGLVVKDYLLNRTDMQARIDQVVTAGTPYYGAALATKALVLGGYDFGIPLLRNSTGEKLSSHAPAVYQLAPSVQYEAQLGQKALYTLIPLKGSPKKYTRAELNALYPNQFLAGLADKRHQQWDTQYPRDISHYHVLSTGKKTVSSFSAQERWFLKKLGTQVDGRYIDLRFEFTPGDETVPAFSAKHQGAPDTRFFYADGSDHTGLVRDQAPRRKIVDILKGQPFSRVDGVRNGEGVDNGSSQESVIAHSFIGDKSDFQNMKVSLTYTATGEKELISFLPDGELDREHSDTRIDAEFVKLPDGKYNLQFFTMKGADYQVSFRGDAELHGVSYEVGKGQNGDWTYEDLDIQESSPLVLKHVGNDTDFHDLDGHIEGEELTE